MNKIIETMKQNPLPLNYPKLPYILMETIRTAWNNEFVAEGDGLLSATNGVYCGQALKEVHFDNDNEKAVSIGLLYSLVPREYTGEWGVEAQMKVPVSINLQASLIFDIYESSRSHLTRGVKTLVINDYPDVVDILTAVRDCLEDALGSCDSEYCYKWLIPYEKIVEKQKSLKERILNEVSNA